MPWSQLNHDSKRDTRPSGLLMDKELELELELELGCNIRLSQPSSFSFSVQIIHDLDLLETALFQIWLSCGWMCVKTHRYLHWLTFCSFFKRYLTVITDPAPQIIVLCESWPFTYQGLSSTTMPWTQGNQNQFSVMVLGLWHWMLSMGEAEPINSEDISGLATS